MSNPSAGLRCGLFLPLVGLSWEDLRARAARAETLGYESCWIDDHFWFPGAPDRPHLEVWTALTALAMETERMRLGPLVMCHSYRSPGLLAKMASSLAEISDGRVLLGVGAGYMDDEYRAFREFKRIFKVDFEGLGYCGSRGEPVEGAKFALRVTCPKR